MSSNAFVLKSVELKNWKTFADATLELSTEGLTGIVGKNGAGKSSFVDAIIWCLFGKQPPGVTKGSLRRRKSDPVKEETSVKVVFTHAGQTIEVYRMMKGKNHTVSGGVFLDGVEVVIATGGTVESWMVNRLGMDAAGFKTAIVVPQKELDSLVDATASIRRESIERLAGIEDMNAAVKKSREAENDIAKQVKVMPGSQEEIDAAEELHTEIEAEYEDILNNLSLAQKAEGESRVGLEKAIEENKESKKRLDASFELHNKITSLRNNQRSAKQSIESLVTQIDEAKSEIGEVDVSQRDALLARYNEITALVNTKREEFSRSESDLRAMNSSLESLQSNLRDAKNRIQKGEEYVEGLKASQAGLEAHQKTEKSIASLEDAVATLQSSTGRLKGQIADLTDSVEALSSLKDAAHCPTCYAELSDPADLIGRLSESRVNLVEQLDNEDSELAQHRTRIKELQVELFKSSKLEGEMENADLRLVELRANAEDIEQKIERLVAGIESTPTLDRGAHEKEMSALDAERVEVVEKGQRITQALKTMERITRLEGNLSKEQSNYDSIAPEMESLQEELDTYGNLEMLDFEVAGNENRIEELRVVQGERFSALKNLESAKGKLEERVSNALENLEREKAIAAQKIKAMETLEERAAVSDLLDEYRKERISRIAPELSATSTEMISRMTNGRFVEVVVANDFSTDVVKEDGQQYAVAELSGGEKSIVALALRISIGSLITGDNAGLLWLDEVLPAQDNERRDAVLGVLRDLPIQQVVMINHTHEAEDVVDNVVRVVYGEDGSSIET